MKPFLFASLTALMSNRKIKPVEMTAFKGYGRVSAKRTVTLVCGLKYAGATEAD